MKSGLVSPVRLLAIVCAVLIGIGVIGFVRFAADVTRETIATAPEEADGIVVFTGGKARIAVAIALLADGKAERLLISGVHPDTDADAIRDGSVGSKALFSCCIDLGRQARNTRGNAVETADWARERGLKSLIVVTSAYHMPRSLAELSHVMPEAVLAPYAVASPSGRENWWRSPPTVRLLLAEYVKCLASRVRRGLAGGSSGAEGTDLAATR